MSERPQLLPGDRVSYGMTLEIKIDGDKAWPKMEINAAVQEGETADEAVARITDLFDRKFDEAMTKSANAQVAANKRG